jgi:hypothetical protein
VSAVRQLPRCVITFISLKHHSQVLFTHIHPYEQKTQLPKQKKNDVKATCNIIFGGSSYITVSDIRHFFKIQQSYAVPHVPPFNKREHSKNCTSCNSTSHVKSTVRNCKAQYFTISPNKIGRLGFQVLTGGEYEDGGLLGCRAV